MTGKITMTKVDDFCQDCGDVVDDSEDKREKHLGHIKAVEPSSNIVWRCSDCTDDMYPRKGMFTFKEIDEAFGAKFKFTEGTDSEHMWLIKLEIDGNNVTGTLDNEPVTVRNVEMGQRITRKISDIEDLIDR